MREILIIAVSMVFVNNYVLARFLGLCPFVNVSRKSSSAFGMGAAVTFVMTLASAVTWLIYTYLLLPDSVSHANLLARLGVLSPDTSLVPVLTIISYILVIAGLVQLVEMVLRKSVPALYRSLGIFLPLITTNCCILGVALLNTTAWPGPTPLGFLGAVNQGFWGGVGFTLVLLLMSAMRERLELAPLPECFKDAPIALVCTGLMAVSFMGFTGIV